MNHRPVVGVLDVTDYAWVRSLSAAAAAENGCKTTKSRDGSDEPANQADNPAPHRCGPLADAEFPTCPAGYDAALMWARSFGIIEIAGVEGTSSYGSGLTRVLQAAQIEVAEVNRPDRAARRCKGKSDPLDAYAATGTALAGDGLAVPKDGRTTVLRALLTARQRGQGPYRRDQPAPRPARHRAR